MTYMHPDIDAHPVTPFAFAGEIYWCQRISALEFRIGILGEDAPAPDIPGLHEAAQKAASENDHG